MNRHKGLLGRLRWKGVALFAIFIAAYSKTLDMLQGSEAPWAAFVVGTLALIPGILFGFLAFRVYRPRTEA